ncbi:NAD(P)/FAD-dependent oxidoreductase [Sideroxydans lithotrophicus]|uniref:Sulfide-quinone reductase n=1 Tax=Sideroxydans lithotrophicus (strain ES-1) TaxID=580332 RepID=D5CQZ7_SIDLE|nr:FAD/NAD(P)-binding oxidoreductase [Sideroxydans lithotrophicus]ADE11383.1 FAD-dependent pyridine nucleotide-disulfide oxidoreductase [Sideroxydans lithotrophicus ES-1]
MAHIVILGAGTAGTPAAYELREALGRQHRITVINASETFQFVPSNPWVALGWRKREDTTFNLRPCLEKKGIALIASSAEKIDAETSRIHLANGTILDYDYLVITTGPRLAFELVDGSGPNGGYTQSVCTVDHACEAYDAYEEFLKDPGHVVVGAFQGASCFGPAYEYAMALDTDLRRRKLRHKVPITYVSPEPYIGHLGLGGVGDSKGLLESELRHRHIKWITNAKTVKVEADKMHVEEYDLYGEKVRNHVLHFNYSMMLPPFRGVPAVTNVAGLCNPAGLVIVDQHQRSPKYHNIFAAGVCIAIPPVEPTPVPVGTPKTGYMIESMVSAIVHNIQDELDGRAAVTTGTWNTICLADMGDTGVAFVALPQIPPRNVTWAKKGKWVHLAKIAFEKYFMRKMKTGTSEPVYEKYVLKALGIYRIK